MSTDPQAIEAPQPAPTARALQARIDWLEGTAMPHARKQENANGFQKGWHAALSRAGEGSEPIDALRALVPEPCADVDETLPWPPQHAPTAWRPIETAPKDGTHVVLWLVDENEDGIEAIGCWFGGWTNPLNSKSYIEEPTHWMPLPAPPDEKGSER